ncbi:MAG: hypothetical protein IKR19_07570 [Acholeplasmatales bacterium]|nr:hypothetical protein [Acholeplasmatales bacterium]
MDLYRLGLPDDEAIIVRDKFVVDTIIPLCLRKATDKDYALLFYAVQDSTESSLFLQSIVRVTDDLDEGFLNNHPLNLSNIRRDPKRLAFYNEKIDSMHGNTYNTDFDMEEYEDNKTYFITHATKAIYVQSTKEPQAALVDVLIPRTIFIRISLFFTKFLIRDSYAESMFITPKLNNLTFETISHVKLDGSSWNKATGMVYNHYTMGNGPTMYKMTFISPAKKDGKLRNPMIAEHYNTFYGKDFLIRDIIFDYHKDRIFVLYELRSDITNQYKGTKILVLNKEIYDHTNLVDLYKVYE